MTAAPARRGPVAALAVSLRPRQWTKNLLVLAVPLAAGRLDDPAVLRATGVAFVAFCAVSSATYLCNDVLDAEADRAHPVKRDRPVARGELAPGVAVAAAVVLLVSALGVAAILTRAELVWTLAAYAVATLTYSVWLKHEAVVELALLTAGFLLRAVAGGAASGLPVSEWFLIVAGFGSLFMAAGKRFSELEARESLTAAADSSSGAEAVEVDHVLGVSDDRTPARRSLADYTPTYLRFVWGLAAAITVTAYCLWAFEVGARAGGSASWAAISVAPFVLAVLRYAVEIDAGRAEAPEDVALRDRTLQVLAVLWLLTFALGALGV